MKTNKTKLLALAVTAALGLAGCESMDSKPAESSAPKSDAMAASMAPAEKVMLSGKEEVPANASSATAEAEVWVSKDRKVTVKLAYSGVEATAAHIHLGHEGGNGPVIVPLEKHGNTFVSAAGASLNEGYYEAWKSGQTYINIHSAKFPGGEIRGQIMGESKPASK